MRRAFARCWQCRLGIYPDRDSSCPRKNGWVISLARGTELGKSSSSFSRWRRPRSEPYSCFFEERGLNLHWSIINGFMALLLVLLRSAVMRRILTVTAILLGILRDGNCFGEIERLPPVEVVLDGPVVLPAEESAPEVTEDTAKPAEESVPSLLVPGTELGDPPVMDIPWYSPRAWFNSKIWAGSYEVGINGSDGSSDSLSLRGGVNFSRETALTNWDMQITYAKTTTGVFETQHNALLYSNWDWKLPWPRWSYFAKAGLEYDEFKDFNVRLNANTGYGYLLIDAPATQFRPRFGAGTSREFGGVDETWQAEAVFGSDFSHEFSPRQKFSGTIDYYPAWRDFSDYRIVTNLNWEMLLDEATNLSLKLSLIDRYDSTPNGAIPNDLLYSLLLLWKI